MGRGGSESARCRCVVVGDGGGRVRLNTVWVIVLPHQPILPKVFFCTGYFMLGKTVE